MSARQVLRPSTLILLIANLFPLYGIAYWGWDAFVLLMLYWMETGIIAFWVIVRIATAPPQSAGKMTVNGVEKPVTPYFLTVFFTLHAGLFMAVHAVFLFALFSGDWLRKTGGVLGFFHHAIFAEGLWVPLLIMFVARGAFVFLQIVPYRLLRLFGAAARAPAQPTTENIDRLLVGLYGRIAVMQVAIIIGGWFSIFLGSLVPLILLIVLKTMAELFLSGVTLGPDGSLSRARGE
jgi:hypothetical protein